MQASKPKPASSSEWLDATRARIEAQRALVETLRPGSKAHRTGVELLLMYQDSLHVLSEADALLARLREARSR